MQHTLLPVGSELPSPHAQGYTERPNGQIVDAADWNPPWGWAAGAMISTLDDMRIWAPTLAGGDLLSQATKAERDKFLSAPSEGKGALYGLGLENQNGWIGPTAISTDFRATSTTYRPRTRTSSPRSPTSSAPPTPGRHHQTSHKPSALRSQS